MQPFRSYRHPLKSLQLKLDVWRLMSQLRSIVAARREHSGKGSSTNSAMDVVGILLDSEPNITCEEVLQEVCTPSLVCNLPSVKLYSLPVVDHFIVHVRK